MSDEPIVEKARESTGLPTVIGAALVAIALIAFIGQNRDGAEVSWLFLDGTWPLWLVIVIAAVLGAVLSEVLGWLIRRRRERFRLTVGQGVVRSRRLSATSSRIPPRAMSVTAICAACSTKLAPVTARPGFVPVLPPVPPVAAVTSRSGGSGRGRRRILSADRLAVGTGSVDRVGSVVAHGADDRSVGVATAARTDGVVLPGDKPRRHTHIAARERRVAEGDGAVEDSGDSVDGDGHGAAGRAARPEVVEGAVDGNPGRIDEEVDAAAVLGACR